MEKRSRNTLIIIIIIIITVHGLLECQQLWNQTRQHALRASEEYCEDNCSHVEEVSEGPE